MFREMMLESTRQRPGEREHQQEAVSADSSGAIHGESNGSPTNKRGATTDLEQEMDTDDRMELEEDVPNSRKRNNQRPSPVKQHVNLFPLFRKPETGSDIKRNLFPGETPQTDDPTSVPLPQSPVQEKGTTTGTTTSLTVDEDVHQSISSGSESETPASPAPTTEGESTPVANHVI